MPKIKISFNVLACVAVTIGVFSLVIFLFASSSPMRRANLRHYDSAEIAKIEQRHIAWLAAGGCAPDADGSVDPYDETSPTGAVPSGAERASFFMGSLRNADFRGKDLRCAAFIGADLEGANFTRADLRGALFHRSTLFGADFSKIDLRGANFRFADVEGLIYDPKVGAQPQYIAFSYNLGYIRSGESTAPLMALKKSFGDGGYIGAKRQVIAAISRLEEPTAYQVHALPFLDEIVRRVRYYAFDLTCEYGADPLRPIAWIAGLWILFSVVYAALLTSSLRSALFLQVWILKSKDPRSVKLNIRHGLAVLRVAALFSGRNAIRLGFAQYDLSRWLRMVQKHDYDLVPTGWLRSVAGVQALLSQYLIALAVLSALGFPFET